MMVTVCVARTRAAVDVGACADAHRTGSERVGDCAVYRHMRLAAPRKQRIAQGWPISQIDALMPWNFKA